MQAAKSAGLSIRPIRTMMNHSTTEVFFDNVEIPAENLVGEEGKGFRYVLSGMNAERILIAAECVGDAKWFIDKATAYGKERVVFGRSIGQNQGVQFPIAKAYAQMRAAELMVHHAAGLFEAGEVAARTRIWPRCWPPTPPGPRQKLAYRPMAVLASPRSTMSSAGPGDAPLSGRADFDRSHLELPGRTCARNAEVLLMSVALPL